MNPAINEMPVTQEEDEAMDALCRLGAGVPLPAKPTKEEWVNYGMKHCTPPSAESLHKPTPETAETNIPLWIVVNNLGAQLQLLATVIKQNQGNSLNAEDQSLQECVNLTLQQAEWFKELVEDKVEELVDNMDHSYGIESAVETHFSNSFSLDDHVDITAEVENRIEEIVEEHLADIVSDKLRNLRITFD